MFTKIVEANGDATIRAVPKEGDLYKVVTVFGKTFELWYGYYEDYERENPTVEPMPIYPNFRKEPLYTDEGEPFVTMMQDACKSYIGDAKRTPDTTCCECKYFQQGEDWIGICLCPKNKNCEI